MMKRENLDTQRRKAAASGRALKGTKGHCVVAVWRTVGRFPHPHPVRALLSRPSVNADGPWGAVRTLTVC